MPIVLSKDELARIQRWTAPDREEAEQVRRRELLRYQQETSRNMTKTWPNSLENVNKRNEEVRQARARAAERANADFYKQYIERRREEQARLLHAARDTVFRNKDAPKLLLSAVIETCILQERSEQVKFKKERQREAAEQKKKEDEEIIRKAKEWEKFKQNQIKLRYEANKVYQQEILEQAHEVAERNRSEYEAELSMQRGDNTAAAQQMAALKQFQDNLRQEEKVNMWAAQHQAASEAGNRRAEAAARETLDDKLIEVLNRARDRVERRRVLTEKQIAADRQRVLDSISAQLETGEAARERKELEMMINARKEREAADENLRRQQAVRRAESRRARTEQREQWQREQAARLRDLDAQLQWDILNRFKNAEVYEEYQRRQRDERARKVKEYRDEILRLWKEREDREAREKAETRHFYGEVALQKLQAADNAVLAHARELLAEARAHARPDLPIKKAVDRYCRMHRLYPAPGLPASLQEHFQRYTPEDRAQLPPANCNGLQDNLSSAKRELPKEEKEEDYKRASRANGLQQRNTEPEDTLPPLAGSSRQRCAGDAAH